MSQYLSQSLSTQMKLEQRLTPQLIQSMNILQKPVADLEAYIQDALETNAALELAERGTEESAEAGAPTTTNESAPRTVRDAEDGFARFERLARSYREFDPEWGEGRPTRSHRTTNERDPKMGAMANTEGRDIGLHELLLNQWALIETDDETRRAGEALINHLDLDGYLRARFEDIAQSVRPPLTVAALEKALPEVQRLEPAGVAARDVIECLLLQLDALPGDNCVEKVLVRNHLDDIAHNRLPAVAKATGFGVGEINEAMRAMRSTLCLHPGYLVGTRDAPLIRPDLMVEYADTGGGLEIRLSRGNMPALRIRDDVAALARSRDNGREARDFARRHVEDATALIDAVNFRRQRMLDVGRAIVEKQRDFFDVGPQGLKVLRMSDLAAELSCDPSTISRTVADKYMQTPRGVYPMRYFFTGGTESDEGESLGWDQVKNRVKELVEGEDRQHPLNDDQIAALLEKEGIHISRRTVAKYRQQLAIPPARQRREF